MSLANPNQMVELVGRATLSSTIALVLVLGRSELAPVRQRVAGEIQRPPLVGRNGAPAALTAFLGDLFALGAAQPKPFFAVNPLNDFDVHPEAFTHQLGVEPARAIPSVLA